MRKIKSLLFLYCRFLIVNFVHISINIKRFILRFRVEVEESMPVHLKSGHTIHLGPPPSSGVILAYILRILDGILPAPNPGLDAHRFVEAFKFGFGERTRLGDHKFVNVSKVCFLLQTLY